MDMYFVTKNEFKDNLKILETVIKMLRGHYSPESIVVWMPWESDADEYKMTGELCFDRCWWTTRQAGGHLFRIDSLEYEMKQTDAGVVIGIHIPSDADFSPEAVERSLAGAKFFFAEHFPELSSAEYRCHSWLLDRQLHDMLNANSNILSFQDRFEIFNEGEISPEVIEWVFQTKSTDYSELAENTSLQRNLKNHLLSGGVIRNVYGKLI